MSDDANEDDKVAYAAADPVPLQEGSVGRYGQRGP